MEIKPEYLARYKECGTLFTLTGNKILIERIEMGEAKTASGLIIAETPETRRDLKLQRPHIGIVIAVGQGYFDADANKYTPLEVKVGNVVIVSSIGVQYYSVLPGAASYSGHKIGLTTETDVQLRFESCEHFLKYEKILNGLPYEK